VLIRPQKAKQQRQQQLLNSAEPGDEVLTVGGLYGIVQSIDEEGDLIVEVAEGIHVRIARRAVATVVKPDDEAEDDADAADEDESDGAERNGAVAELTTGEEAPADGGRDPGDTPHATPRRLFGRRN
jgi:preprotein translocase subunit YajC